MNKEVTLPVPLALQNLIKANNTLLKSYQSQLMDEVQQANTQMMQILQIDPRNGWRLDVENMVYVRVEQQAVDEVTSGEAQVE